MPKWITSQQLRAAQGPVDSDILKVFAVVVDKDATTAARTVRFTITTDDVDRENDVISADGWKTDNFIAAKGPVLWSHDYRQPPIARTLSLVKSPHGLSAEVQFADAETYAFADTIYRLVKGGFLSATSVGFRALKWEFDEVRGGINYNEQELHEFSVCSVPANPHCLIEARSAGIDVEPLREWAAKTIEYLTEQKAVETIVTPVVQTVAPSFDLTALKHQVDEALGAVGRFTVLVQGLGESLAKPPVKAADPLACPKGSECQMDANGACALPSGDCPKKAVPVTETKDTSPASVVDEAAHEATATGGDSSDQDAGAETTFDIIPDDEADVELSVDDIRAAMRDALKETVGTAINKRLGRVD